MLVTVLANGVVGGIAVRTDLHPALVQSHFLLAMASIAFGLVAVHRASDAVDVADPVAVAVPVPRRCVDWSRAVGTLTALALVTGTVVTGTGPHAGEEDVRRWGFDISTVARIHSVCVLLAVGAALLFALQLRREPSDIRQRSTKTLSAWMFVAVLQGGVGYVQYFTGVPEILVGAHIAGATFLWVATVWLVLGVREPQAEETPIALSGAIARSM